MKPLRWCREHLTEILLVLACVLIVGAGIWAKSGSCSHGRHQGTCGREHRVQTGKYSVTKTCDCVIDHY